jgi:hypothetical protein
MRGGGSLRGPARGELKRISPGARPWRPLQAIREHLGPVEAVRFITSSLIGAIFSHFEVFFLLALRERNLSHIVFNAVGGASAVP